MSLFRRASCMIQSPLNTHSAHLKHCGAHSGQWPYRRVVHGSGWFAVTSMTARPLVSPPRPPRPPPWRPVGIRKFACTGWRKCEPIRWCLVRTCSNSRSRHRRRPCGHVPAWMGWEQALGNDLVQHGWQVEGQHSQRNNDHCGAVQDEATAHAGLNGQASRAIHAPQQRYAA